MIKTTGRLSFKHDEVARQKIRVSEILTRLLKHVDGSVEMSPTQIRAAEILLKKALPDLSSVELSGGTENQLNVIIHNPTQGKPTSGA